MTPRIKAPYFSQPEHGGKHRILLEPYGYRWFRVGGLDHPLRRARALPG